MFRGDLDGAARDDARLRGRPARLGALATGTSPTPSRTKAASTRRSRSSAPSSRRRRAERLIGDVPYGLLLSGGVDSTLVASFITEHEPDLKTFTISRGDQRRRDRVREPRGPPRRDRSPRHPARRGRSGRHRGPDPVDVRPAVLQRRDDRELPDRSLGRRRGDRRDHRRRRRPSSSPGRSAISATRSRDRCTTSSRARSWPPGSTRPRPGAVSRRIRACAGPERGCTPQASTTAAAGSRCECRTCRSASARSSRRPFWKKNGIDPEAAALAYYDRCDSPDHLNRLLYAETKFELPANDLLKVDRAFMYNSMAGRSPFLDRRVVEFAARIPADWKRRGRTFKWFLRELARTRIPAELVVTTEDGARRPLPGLAARAARRQGRASARSPRASPHAASTASPGPCARSRTTGPGAATTATPSGRWR